MILVVEDEAGTAEVVSLYLRRAGFDVEWYVDGASALSFVETQKPELVLLDLMLPDMDGVEMLKRLREVDDLPVVVISARMDEQDRIGGLELGADDYIAKPFSPQELVSRVRAVLRRYRKNGVVAGDGGPLAFGDLQIDPVARVVEARGSERRLTTREFDLLWLLARNARRAFSRDELLDQVWGCREHIDAGTVSVHVRRVRQKIERDPSNPRHLHTVRGFGYRFDP